SDTHHESLPDSAIDRMYAVMALCPQHTFMVPTKRAKRRLQYQESRSEDPGYLAEHIEKLIDEKLAPPPCGWKRVHYDSGAEGGDSYDWEGPLPLPLPNVWEGVSVEDQATADERIPLLLQTPAALRFVSYEPALGPVQLTRHHQWCPEHDYEGGFCCSPCPSLRSINWLIAGGESGPGARPSHPDWFRSVRDQCQAAGVPFFFKGWGAWAPWPHGPVAGLKLHQWPDGTVSARFSKRIAGRLLDGREHGEGPPEALKGETNAE
ncbi:MAG TPA: DUF5131 family protein, partial [Planctomycetota bacterium]|nr:DUF5131 family protein [Planctomycetota bacterium]